MIKLIINISTINMNMISRYYLLMIFDTTIGDDIYL